MTSRLSFIFENYTTIYRIFTSISKILLKSFPEIIRKSLKQKFKVIFVSGLKADKLNGFVLPSPK